MFPELVTRPDLHVFLAADRRNDALLLRRRRALGNAATKVACRVHDECNGSDVFGSDICTCRPYLAHGVEVCIEMAQQGGVGLVVYNRKEGRALGEVTKFLVYNARKRQVGGDRAATYFERTECVAGVQDMRFQELMPDVFHWLGIDRIDRWASMSNMKRDALTAQGISVVEQVAIPGHAHSRGRARGDGCQEGSRLLRAGAGATVRWRNRQGPRARRVDGEPHAVPDAHPAAKLLTAAAVRDRCMAIMSAAERGDTRYLAWDSALLPAAAAYVADTIRQRYPTLEVPYHSRWRHFEAGSIDRWGAIAAMLEGDAAERARTADRSRDPERPARCRRRPRVALCRCGHRMYARTLGGPRVASLRLFASGAFSGRAGSPFEADARALAALATSTVAKGFQVTADNPLVGLEGRAALLRRLGAVASACPTVFGAPARLGNLYDYLVAHARHGAISAAFLLATLLRALGPSGRHGSRWKPCRSATAGGIRRRSPRIRPIPPNGLVPFHKLTQWLAYSLLEPLEEAGLEVTGLDQLTGLPEYRNGGLLLDTGSSRRSMPSFCAARTKPATRPSSSGAR
jgi:GTP cyclohydrolase II